MPAPEKTVIRNMMIDESGPVVETQQQIKQWNGPRGTISIILNVIPLILFWKLAMMNYEFLERSETYFQTQFNEWVKMWH